MSSLTFHMDDNDLDDAELWAVIDSAAASHSASKSRKILTNKTANIRNSIPCPNFAPAHKSCSNFSSAPHKSAKSHKHSNAPKNEQWASSDGEVLQEPCHWGTSKMYASPKEDDNNNNNNMVILRRNFPNAPSPYSSSESKSLPTQVIGPRMANSSEHCLSGRFPSVSLFKQYQNAAMAILEKTDYVLIHGRPYIKKAGWRKISCYFNISYEIRERSIEWDERQNVQRAEFVVRAYMQGGRFSDAWGSCGRGEKHFNKPNNDIPSIAETRAKNKACQDLLGIGEYKPDVAVEKVKQGAVGYQG